MANLQNIPSVREAQSKNIIVGAAMVYVGPPLIENGFIEPMDKERTLTDPANVRSLVHAEWYNLGYTTDGLTFTIEPDYGEVQVDQLLDVARIFKQSQTAMLETQLAEATLENLFVAVGGGIDDLNAGAAYASPELYNHGVGVDIGASTGEGAYGEAAVDETQFSGLNPVASTDGNQAFAASAIGNGYNEYLLGHASTGNPVGAADLNKEQIYGIFEINGGALGEAPLERSICFVGPAPISISSGKRSERVYIGHRAMSMESVGHSIQRDEATTYPVNFRLFPSSMWKTSAGSAGYGRIFDRVYGTGLVTSGLIPGANKREFGGGVEALSAEPASSDEGPVTKSTTSGARK